MKGYGERSHHSSNNRLRIATFEILKYAEAFGANAIAMGTHGRA